MSYYLGCKVCPNGTYSALGDPICRDCPNVDNVDYDTVSIGNQYLRQCYHVEEVSPWAWWLTPGDISLWSILLYLIFLIIFTMIGAILRKKIKK